MVNLLTATTFVLVMSLVWLVTRIVLRSRQAVPVVDDRPVWQVLVPSKPRGSPFAESLAAQFPETLISSGEEELHRDFRRAGYYGPHARRRFLMFRNGLTILAVFATGGVAVAIGPGHQKAVTWTLVIGLTVAILCFALPRVILAAIARRRVRSISNALPDALDTVTMCLHGGISLQECLGFVGQGLKSVYPDLALELQMIGQHGDINSFEFAVRQFADRIDSPDIVAWASLVTQNQRLGTGIVDSIQEFADSLRLKRRQMAEAKAGRAELFLLFPVVFCLAPSVIILLLGPPILSLIDFLVGPGSPLRIAK